MRWLEDKRPLGLEREDAEPRPLAPASEEAVGIQGDVVGEYLREIGRHGMLTAAEEIRLGLSVEIWVKLRRIREAEKAVLIREPTMGELAAAIYRRLRELYDWLGPLASALDIATSEETRHGLLFSRETRQAIDAALDSELVRRVAEAAASPEVEAFDGLSELSRLSRLLPPEAIQSADAATGEGKELAPVFLEHRGAIEGWWQRVEQEGKEAAERLTNGNLRLVVSVARRHLGRGLPLLDLIQEGNLGLMKAAEKFDPHKGYKFSTYATWWIRQSVSRGLADQARTIRLPAHVVERTQQLYNATRELFRELGREPTPQELADELGWSVEKLEELWRHQQKTISLETPVGEGEDSTLEDFIYSAVGWGPDELAIRELTREEVLRAIDELPPRLRLIILLRFGFLDNRPLTLEEVGRSLGVTRERVRQLEKQAIERLRGSKLLPRASDSKE